MMLSVDGCIKSVKIYKNLEKLYNKKSWLFMTLFLYKSPLSIWIICCQFFFTNCRITIHYFLPYIYIYIYIYIFQIDR